ncbi:MAG: MarR family transcriptional regulator [Actinobacteria bacterium]|nr:MarR family transcriptional regulator [Actinomycetota bacterium]
MTAIRSDDVTEGLDDHLCLALYLASRAMTATYRPVLDELGLTYPQYLVLMLLWEQGTSSVGEIGARLHLESNTLSPLVKRLEALELVTRQRRAGDERTVDVQLTRQGKAMRRRAAGVPAHVCRATELDATSRARLTKKLRRLTDDLEKKHA